MPPSHLPNCTIDRPVEPEARALRLDDLLRDVGAFAAQHHFHRIAAHQRAASGTPGSRPRAASGSSAAGGGRCSGAWVRLRIEEKAQRTAGSVRCAAHAALLPVQPDVGQVLPDVMARRDVPALQLLVVHDDAVPPDRRDDVGLLEQRGARTRAAARRACPCRARPTACRRARRACGRCGPNS